MSDITFQDSAESQAPFSKSAIFSFFEKQKIDKTSANFAALNKMKKLFRRKELSKAFLEILVMLIFPWPYFDKVIISEYRSDSVWVDKGVVLLSQQMLSDYGLVFTMLRGFYIISALINFSHFNGPMSQKFCHEQGFEPNFVFIMKCFFKQHPAKVMITIFVMLICAFALLFQTFELAVLVSGDINSQYSINSYWDAVYFTIITITSVGYGDELPISYPTKALVCLAAMCSSVFMSMLVYTTNSKLFMTEDQLNAYLRFDLTQTATQILVKTMRLNNLKKLKYEALVMSNPV